MTKKQALTLLDSIIIEQQQKWLVKHPNRYNDTIAQEAVSLVLAANAFKKARTEKTKAKYKTELVKEITHFKEWIAIIDPGSKYSATKRLFNYIAGLESLL